MTTPNAPAISRALSAIHDGHIDSGEWSAPDKEDREQDDCLGVGKAYPVFAGTKISKRALANTESRAIAQGHPEIANHAKRLLKMIDDRPALAADSTETAAADPADEPAEHLRGVYISLASDFSEALTMGQGLPKTRNGKPCKYFWKEALRGGSFVDSRGNPWEFKPSDIDDIVHEHKRAMKLASHEPGLDERHPTKENPSRGKNYGWVVDARKNAKGRLELLHQFVGDAETSEALNKKSSILLVPGKKDHLGNSYKWWIEQNAIVSNAQLRDLDPEFKPALAASGELIDAAYLSLSEETPSAGTTPEKVESTMGMTSLRAALGEKAKDKPDAEVLALSASEYTAAQIRLTQLEKSLADQAEANSVLAGELAVAEQTRDRALSLSTVTDELIDESNPQILALSGRLMETTIANALLTEDINPDQAAWLKTACKESRELMLSADPVNGFTEVDRLIGFAKLGKAPKGAITPNKPINRGTPVKAIPAPPTTALSLAGAEDAPSEGPNGVSLEVHNKNRANAGLPPLASWADR